MRSLTSPSFLLSFKNALDSAAGFGKLRELVLEELYTGTSRSETLEALEQLRLTVDETLEEKILAIMDILADWRSPRLKIPETKPQHS